MPVLIRCSSCRVEKPPDDFHRDRARHTGRASRCKPCQAAYYREWQIKNRDAVNAYQRRYWSQEAPASALAKRQRRTSAWHRRMYRTNPAYRESVLSAQRSAYAANPGKFKERVRAWQKAHPEVVRAMTQRRRARERGARRDVTVIAEVVFEDDGYLCWLCGEPTEPGGAKGDRPTMDHVVPVSLGGAHVYENIRCAHHRCNSARGNRISAKALRRVST